jgi:hypothetical protein
MFVKKFLILVTILPVLQGCLATFQTAQTLKRGETKKFVAFYYPFSYRVGAKGGLTNHTELEFILDGIVFLPPVPHSVYLGLKQGLFSEKFVSSAILARGGFTHTDFAYQTALLLSLSFPQSVLTVGTGVVYHPGYPYCDIFEPCYKKNCPAYHFLVNLEAKNTPPKAVDIILEMNFLEMFKDQNEGRFDYFTAGVGFVWK